MTVPLVVAGADVFVEVFADALGFDEVVVGRLDDAAVLVDAAAFELDGHGPSDGVVVRAGDGR